ncbi:undecaprenyl-diphosphate phosphatase [Helicovermis profundi]|uniref:Undecaprenyl-diphosphatase n=1 Tax=Helicovermis profundi TaxID=3065157 RepID=A0AAU9E5W6_9FIRM|nr:undecaprenyl-diphosphate phosphatase [Clostridia bacterium S502]
MILIIKAIILGIIEGLTEFLPVSSTGHLIIANKFLSFEGDFANLFSIVIQTGAIFAVILYFKDKVFPKFDSSKSKKAYISLWSKVIIGIIPAGILGVLFDSKIEAILFHPIPVAITLIIGAIIIILAEKSSIKVTVKNDSEITYKNAFLVGVFQCLALIPGMSRSASTIIGGMFLGFDRSVAAEFSFFLAIPTLLGAGLVKILKASFVFTSFQWILLFIGTFVSFVVAYFVIAFFMNYIKKKNLIPFAYYRIILGIMVLLILR